MARQTNAAYWAQRMKNMEDALLDQSYSYVENLEKQFAAAQAEIERQMARWYQRFATNNEIDLAEAKRLLNSKELKEFHWTVAEYIAHGEQNAIDGAWMKQLENASAKVHISRLEALKLQLQQQAEVLYSNQLDYVDAAARKMYEGSYYHTAFELQKGLGVGWTMQALNEETITKVLSHPWTTDNQTFRDRCWTNKQSLVNSVNTQLTQMVIRGEAPDRAISAISKQFDVSRAKAGRLVMTESAYFSSAGQKDCYKALDVERYKIVASFDKDTCSLCADMDGKVFKMSEYQVGLTAPPFHPWCRCCTCPYFEDMDGMGERYARDAVTGERFKVPGNMTYDQWKAQQDALHGQGTVDKMRKISYNETTDRAQFEKYRERLGADAPRYFKAFQALKYDHAAEYKDLAGLYSYKGRVPEASKADYKAYEAVKATGVPGSVRVPAKPIEVDELVFKDAHGTHHGCTLEDAKGYIRQAKCSTTPITTLLRVPPIWMTKVGKSTPLFPKATLTPRQRKSWRCLSENSVLPSKGRPGQRHRLHGHLRCRRPPAQPLCAARRHRLERGTA